MRNEELVASLSTSGKVGKSFGDTIRNTGVVAVPFVPGNRATTQRSALAASRASAAVCESDRLWLAAQIATAPASSSVVTSRGIKGAMCPRSSTT